MRFDRPSNRAVLVFTVALASACTGVDGGAVELSWRLRPASSALEDKFVDCDSNKPGTKPIAAIRLDWTVEQQTDHDQWSCSDSHGVTGFVLPVGHALFSISPVCGDAAANPASYIAPAVEQRDVILGDTVSLGAMEVVVQVTDCSTQDCICE